MIVVRLMIYSRDHSSRKMAKTSSGNSKIEEFVKLVILLNIVYSTGLSYDKSYVAVYTVISHIQESVPVISEAMTQIIQDLANQKVCNIMYCNELASITVSIPSPVWDAYGTNV